jgi:hypothetical protein
MIIKTQKQSIFRFGFRGLATARENLIKLRSLPARRPLAFGASITGFKTVMADLLTQKIVEGREDINWKRTLTFAVFGFGYMGIVQYGVYVKLMAGRLFPNAAAYAAKPLSGKIKDVKGTRELFAQVFLDNFVHIPFM